jgi:hypothetical protein
MDPEVIQLIRRMSRANPLWGAPRIDGELLKLGIEIAETTVAKDMIKRHGPPSQAWRTFLANYAKDTIAIDLHGADGYVQSAVRIDRVEPRPATHPALQRHRASDGHLDRTPTASGLRTG